MKIPTLNQWRALAALAPILPFLLFIAVLLGIGYTVLKGVSGYVSPIPLASQYDFSQHYGKTIKSVETGTVPRIVLIRFTDGTSVSLIADSNTIRVSIR